MTQKSNGAESEPGVLLDAAALRLERAVSLLESRVAALSGEADGGNGSLFEHDRSKLAAELDAARARERELEEVGAEASLALGKAIDGIRRVLDRVEDRG